MIVLKYNIIEYSFYITIMYYIVRFNGILTVMLPCGIGRTLYIGIQITAMLYSFTKFILNTYCIQRVPKLAW